MWTTYHFVFHIYVPYSHFVKRTRTGINHGVTSRTTGAAWHLLDTENRASARPLCFSASNEKRDCGGCSVSPPGPHHHITSRLEKPFLLCFTGDRMSRAKGMNIVCVCTDGPDLRRGRIPNIICAYQYNDVMANLYTDHHYSCCYMETPESDPIEILFLSLVVWIENLRAELEWSFGQIH